MAPGNGPINEVIVDDNTQYGTGVNINNMQKQLATGQLINTGSTAPLGSGIYSPKDLTLRPSKTFSINLDNIAKAEEKTYNEFTMRKSCRHKNKKFYYDIIASQNEISVYLYKGGWFRYLLNRDVEIDHIAWLRNGDMSDELILGKAYLWMDRVIDKFEKEVLKDESLEELLNVNPDNLRAIAEMNKLDEDDSVPQSEDSSIIGQAVASQMFTSAMKP